MSKAFDNSQIINGTPAPIDADTVDGLQASSFANTSLSNVLDTTILTKIKRVNGHSSGLDADLLDGKDSTAFVEKTNLLSEIRAIDGAGSGLDADLLDGKDSTAFVEKTNLLSEIRAIDGAGSGLDADLIRGLPADFSKSFTTNGYQKLPSGLIIQWGFTRVSNVTFPVAFPKAVLSAMMSKGVVTNTSAINGAEIAIGFVTLTGMQVAAYHSSVGFVTSQGVLWMAIGH